MNKIIPIIISCLFLIGAVLMVIGFKEIISLGNAFETFGNYTDFRWNELKDNKINFYNLSNREINHINRVLDDVRPIFLEEQGNLHFVNNIGDFCDDCEKIAGLNRGKGANIVVEYYKEDEKLRYYLCHELLHTYTRTNLPRDFEEELVATLGKSFVCYDDVFPYFKDDNSSWWRF